MRSHPNDRTKKANAMIIAIIPVVVITALAVTYVTVSSANAREVSRSMSRLRALYAAEAGFAAAMKDLNLENRGEETIGSPAGEVQGTLQESSYSVRVINWANDGADNDGDGQTDESDEAEYRTVISEGVHGHATRRLEAVLTGHKPHPLFYHAIYAANYSGDPSYEMQFGGQSGSPNYADLVNGDLYASGDVKFTGNSLADGDVHATGSITGNPPKGEAIEGADPIDPPDIASMNYESTADYRVDSTLNWTWWSQGGQRLYSSNPCHIFARNHRTDLGVTTDNDNYFLVDPYTTTRTDREEPGSPTYGKSMNEITLHPDGNDKVYFVDGNLWLEPWTFSSKLMSAGTDGSHVTIVVKGNVYVCDALYYENPDLDAISFIAITDGESYVDANGNNRYDTGEILLHDDGDGVYDGPREGSGNIYFGDPNTGPVGTVNAFLYAENDFVDHVLDQDGKPLDFKINGIMTAGNQVRINRDFGGQHARMIVNCDDRLKNKTLAMPSLPQWNTTSGRDWQIVSWREIAPSRSYAALGGT